MVKVIPYAEGEPEPGGRRGFMAGEISVPDDFDRMDAMTIVGLFDGHDP